MLDGDVTAGSGRGPGRGNERTSRRRAIAHGSHPGASAHRERRNAERTLGDTHVSARAGRRPPGPRPQRGAREGEPPRGDPAGPPGRGPPRGGGQKEAPATTAPYGPCVQASVPDPKHATRATREE